MGTVTQWRLYVDETGRVERPEEFAVAGVLLPWPLPDVCWPGPLRRALERAAPGVPWPLHGWLLRKPAAFALWSRNSSAPDPRAEAALASLEALLPGVVSEALDQIAKGREPSATALKRLRDTLLARDARSYQGLLAYQREVRAQVTWILQRVAAEGVSVCAAAASEPRATGEGDLYLDLLATLFGRVADRVYEEGGSHRVDLHVLRRDAWSERLERNVVLTLEQIAGEAANAVGAPDRTLRGQGATVRLNPAGQGAAWGPETSPYFVLADLAANEARQWLHKGSTPLRKIEAGLERALCFRTRGPKGTSLLAASGPARTFLEQVRAGEASLPSLGSAPGRRAWAVQQANAWAPILGRR